MSNYAWVIDESYIEEEIPLDDWGKLSCGVKLDPPVMGPRDASGIQLKKATTDGMSFRIYDDDGILYYSGKCWSEDKEWQANRNSMGEEFFGPLYDFGAPNAGATEIKYFMPNGRLETL